MSAAARGFLSSHQMPLAKDPTSDKKRGHSCIDSGNLDNLKRCKVIRCSRVVTFSRKRMSSILLNGLAWLKLLSCLGCYSEIHHTFTAPKFTMNSYFKCFLSLYFRFSSTRKWQTQPWGVSKPTRYLKNISIVTTPRYAKSRTTLPNLWPVVLHGWGIRERQIISLVNRGERSSWISGIYWL